MVAAMPREVLIALAAAVVGVLPAAASCASNHAWLRQPQAAVPRRTCQSQDRQQFHRGAPSQRQEPPSKVAAYPPDSGVIDRYRESNSRGHRMRPYHRDDHVTAESDVIFEFRPRN